MSEENYYIDKNKNKKHTGVLLHRCCSKRIFVPSQF